MKPVALLALALALAGCGGGREHGQATLWVTRDRGATVLYTGTVPAGLTAMQALDRRLKIETRYGGRFVQAIDGVEGDAGKQRDWFWYVNGIEGDRSAAEYRLRPGDVEWWDYRPWKGSQMSVPVVVGSWPKPLARDAVVLAADDAATTAARRLARSLHVPLVLVGAVASRAATGDEVVVQSRPVVFHGERARGHVRFVISAADAVRLAVHPTLARFHYEGLG